MFKIMGLTAKVDNNIILNDFNMEINDGEIHVIMGHNGVGKSTLCKIIMNDENYDILNGKILFNGKNLRDLKTYEIAREGIMLISQNPIAIEGVTNAEVLRTALRETRNDKINIFDFNKKMEEVCDKLKLSRDFIHKDINVGASGGERKKIELLHMAILEPKFIMLDEIDSGLDVDAIKDVASFINEYHKETKCSILIITHHPNIIDYIKPNYVHILDEGHIVKTGDYLLAKQIEKYGFVSTNAMTEDGNHE
ncbi:MAG: Fe-S cluster assembly ATPase SufC [Bacilli bacterium]|nr:Fe-S cluster assembly ATPase SufC [Bacilli bacterium]